MKFEEKNRMTRKGLVKFFKGLSELVEKNELLLGEERITLTDSMDVEVEYKEKKGRAKLEIEVKWTPVTKGEGADESMEKSSINEVKQGVKRSFNSIRATAERGENPSAEEVKNFIDLNRQFNEIAKGSDYEGRMGPFMDLVSRLGEAHKAGNMEELASFVNELRASKKSCHKTFRWREK
jgi:XXXCH domain-containing protein